MKHFKSLTDKPLKPQEDFEGKVLTTAIISEQVTGDTKMTSNTVPKMHSKMIMCRGM
jgi:hypothetical protein